MRIAGLTFATILTAHLAFAANEASQTFTLDGDLYQTGTTTSLLDTNAKLTVQIINPAGNCLLYEEEQFVNTNASKGHFTIYVGSTTGTAKRTVNDPGQTMSRIFQNIVPIPANHVPGQNCIGSSYSPAAGAVRYFRVIVTPSATNLPDTLTPDIVINSVPSALIADSVQGVERAHILQVKNSGSTVLTQANLEALFTTPGYANLQSILAGNFITTDTSGAALPSYATNPAGAAIGDIWFDSATGQIKYQNSGGVQTVGAAGSGGITSLTMGSSFSVNGTVAGTISNGSGTMDLTNTGVGAGTYTKVTVDTKGRVTAGTISLVEADIPNLTSAGKVSGNTITSGTISGSAGINTSGNLVSTGTVSGLTVQATNVRVYNGLNYVQMTASTMSGNVNLTLPTTDGNAGEFLKTDGTGILSWATSTVTSTDITTALSYTPLSAAATFSGDVSGTYSTTSVDKIKGKAITAATVSGQMMIYNGSTWMNSVMSGDATLAHDGMLTLSKVPVSKGGTNAVTFGNNKIISSNGTGSTLQDFSCSLNQVISFDASGYAVCANVSSLSGAILNGGNTTGADISVGTNDNKAISFKTNNTVAMTISQSGNVGIGTATPVAKLDVNGDGNFSGVLSFPGGVGANPGFHFSTVGSADSYGTNIGFGLDTGTNIVAAVSTKDFRVVAGSGATPFRVTNAGNTIQTGTLTVQGTGNSSFVGNVGIGISNPSTALDISGAINQVGIAAPAVSPATEGRIYYDRTANKFKVSQNGAAYVDLIGGGSITSLGGQTGGTQTLAISVDNSVALPTITSATNAHTWKIPMASNAGTTAGLLNKTDYDLFAAKLGTTTSFAGDVSGAYNATVVQKIQGRDITAASVSGQMMIYSGTAWTNNVMSGDATLAHDGMFVLNKVPVSKGGTNAITFGNNRIIASNGTGTALQDFTCSLNQVISFDASGNAACANVSSLSAAILNGGNTTGADISIGTNDAKHFSIKTNNTKRFNIDPTNGYATFGVNGSTVGAATTNTPSILLHDDSGGLPRFVIKNGYWADPVEMEMASLNGTGGIIGTATNHPITFRTYGNEVMRLTASGRLGIGTTVPSTALDISGAFTAQGMSSAPAVSSANTGRIYYDYAANKFKVSQNGAAYVDLVSSATSYILNGGNTTGADISIGTNDNKALSFKTNNTVAMTISQGGYVGIGTTTPSNLLSVKSPGLNGPGTNAGISLQSSGGGNGVGINLDATGDTGGHNYLFFASAGAAGMGQGGFGIWDATASAYRLNITSSGNVGIGKISPTVALDVSGSIATNGAGGTTNFGTGQIVASGPSGGGAGMYVNIPNTATSYGGFAVGYGTTTKWLLGMSKNVTDTTGFVFYEDGAAAYPRLMVATGGNVGIGTLTPTTALDVSGAINLNGIAAPAVSSASEGRIYYDRTANKFKVSQNGAAYSDLIPSITGNILNGGNTTGADITIGTNDNKALHLKTNNTTALTISQSGYIGIGTTSPGHRLDIVDNGDDAGVKFTEFSSTYSADMRIYRARGTQAGPTALANADIIGGINFFGYGSASVPSASSARIEAVATEAYTASARGAALTFRTAANGGTTTSEAMRIHHNGKVGIGTNDPQNKLHIVGDGNALFMEPTTGTNGVATYLLNTGNGTLFGIESASGGWLINGSNPYASIFGNQSARDFQIGTNNAVRMTITSAGDVGIGISNPTGKFEVQGGTSTTGHGKNISLVAQSGLASGNTNGGHIYLTPGAANGTGVAGSVVVNQVGINLAGGTGGGGSNPAAGFNGIYSSGLNRLDFATNGTNRFSVLANGNVVMGSEPTKIIGNNYWDYGSNTNGFGMDTSGTYLKTASTTRLTVDNTGKVGIGGAAASEKLEVVGNIKTSGCLYYASSSLGTCASDEKIKEDVRPFELGLEALLGIQPVHFKYNGLAGFPKDGKEQLGVIAQQVETVAPELVKKQMVTLHPTDKKKTEISVVDYGAFTYLIINSVKELYRQWFQDSQALHRDIASVQSQISKKDQKIQELEQENESIRQYLCQKDPKAPFCISRK